VCERTFPPTRPLGRQPAGALKNIMNVPSASFPRPSLALLPLALRPPHAATRGYLMILVRIVLIFACALLIASSPTVIFFSSSFTKRA